MLLAAEIAFFAKPSAADDLPRDAPLKIRLEFRIPPEQLSDLRTILSEFAERTGLAVNDLGSRMPARQGRPLFYIELDQGDSVKVTVTNIRREDRIFVWFYEFRPNSNLKEIDSLLERALREKWPTLAPYKGS